jgi:GNAT superfamily N-acetyltransferase/NTP pyrophosphatase (non-canonical NTP hydrolase)
MTIEQISPDSAEALCRRLTASLPDYFGLPEANEHYAAGVRTRINFAVYEGDVQVSLLSIDFTYPSNCNIYWMAVAPEFQGKGIGRRLVQAACAYGTAQGARTLTVETLAPSEADANYLKTYKFYEECGFEPLFNLKPHGYEWNMVYMVKKLDNHIARLTKLEYEGRDFGFYWPNHEIILEQITSEVEEIKEAILAKESSERIQSEIGDLIHSAVSLCLFCGFDVDQTLDKSCTKFGTRMALLQEVALKRGLDNLLDQPLNLKLELWEEVKKIEKKSK